VCEPVHNLPLDIARAQLLGEVEFDPFTHGLYATDASHYQIMPLGVVAPRSVKEVEYAVASRPHAVEGSVSSPRVSGNDILLKVHI
jgi:hypothetical protein